MQMNDESLLSRLSEYGQTDFYPFHMPGHKRREMWDRWEGVFPNPYSVDITEIDGFDNLHHPEGILKESMERAAKVYGADQTYYLVNGSTSGILSAICASTTHGGKILISRNCHKSAYHGLILNRLSPVYLYPQVLSQYGILGGIRPEDVWQALEGDRNSNDGMEIQAALLVSPTYEGIVSDIEKIANIVHEYKIPLIVDEAHGAHFPFSKGGERGKSDFPVPALDLGADIVIQSLHKTLPSFTQTAVLHRKGSLADQEKIERYLGMFQSSSPSYLFMAAMERCIRFMDGDGRREMAAWGRRMDAFFRDLEDLKVLNVVTDFIKNEESVFDWDPSKVVISTEDAADLDGEALGHVLRERYHLEMEMCATQHVVAMTSLMDTEEGLERLKHALLELDRELVKKQEMGPQSQRKCLDIEREKENTAATYRNQSGGRKAETVLIPAIALERQGERLELSMAAGRISKEFVSVYPPGIPLLVPGERITEETLECLNGYVAAGLSVQGLSDGTLSTILAVAEL